MNSYLQTRKDHCYFRIRVPGDLRQQLPSEIVFPIHGLDLQTASLRCRLLGTRLQRIFEQARAGFIKMSILHPYIREICANILYTDELRMYSASVPVSDFDAASNEYLQAIRSKSTEKAAPLIELAKQQGITLDQNDPKDVALFMNFYQGMREVLRIEKQRSLGNLKNGYDRPFANGQMSSLLSRQDVTLRNTEPDDARLPDDVQLPTIDPADVLSAHEGINVNLSAADQLARISAQNRRVHTEQKNEQMFARMQPVIQSGVLSQPSVQQMPVQNQQPLPAGIRKAVAVSDAIEMYLSEMRANIDMTPKVEDARRTMLSVLAEYYGPDRKLYEFDREMMMKLRTEVLPRYPLNRFKIKEYKEMPLSSLLRLQPKPKTIAEKTQIHYMEYWSMMFNWAVRCGYATLNPLQGIVKKRTLTDLTEERPPFTKDELKKIESSSF